MFMEQIYTKCLAEAAYYIESDGEAAIIDPLRDIEIYLQLARSRGSKIKYILETHFHADFVSGHLDLARETGAPIVFGPSAKTKFKIKEATDNEILPLGKSQIKVLHTPGHTLESVSYLWLQPDSKPYAVFTGDTLFIGDVGRPDLVGGTSTKEEMASLLFDSLESKIKNLPDDVLVYPGHGAGSACGKNISKATFSTIGEQKKENYALQIIKKSEFIQQVTNGLANPPPYFPFDAVKNKQGYPTLKEILNKGKTPLSVDQFQDHINKGALVLDTRNPEVFAKGYIENSLNIGLDGQFAVWVGHLVPPDAKILLLVDENKIEESITRLARIGFDSTIGYLNGGIAAWQKSKKELNVIQEIEASEFKNELGKAHVNILDVRNKSESKTGILKGAMNICLSQLPNELNFLAPNKKYFVHCAGGYRSMMACSLLKRNGFTNVINVIGGLNALKNLKVPLIDCNF